MARARRRAADPRGRRSARRSRAPRSRGPARARPDRRPVTRRDVHRVGPAEARPRRTRRRRAPGSCCSRRSHRRRTTGTGGSRVRPARPIDSQTPAAGPLQQSVSRRVPAGFDRQEGGRILRVLGLTSRSVQVPTSGWSAGLARCDSPSPRREGLRDHPPLRQTPRPTRRAAPPSRTRAGAWVAFIASFPPAPGGTHRTGGLALDRCDRATSPEDKHPGRRDPAGLYRTL